MNKFGHYEGTPLLDPLEPPIKRKWWEVLFPRRPELNIVRGFTYVDPEGQRWLAGAGLRVNGVSSPRILWRILPPFAWREIRSSVIHDVFCQLPQEKNSRSVHQMFYCALRCDGVCKPRAFLMWAAVRAFGPRF